MNANFSKKFGNIDYERPDSMTNNDMISRSYAINRLRKAMRESKSSAKQDAIVEFVGFLTLLPSVSELEEQVYCTDCKHFKLDGEDIDCDYKDICCFYNPEDSMARNIRCFYSKY